VSILLSAHHLSKGYGARPLFDDLNFVVSAGERIGLIGPNGAGKSSLLRILAGQTSPDKGDLSSQRGLRTGFLEQTPVLDPNRTVEASVLEGTPNPDDWESIALCRELISKLSLDRGEVTPQTQVGKLSGGWKKRVALARELARRPDLLLLDEPTNHLDIESILWLEDFLAKSGFATLTVTHDRLFLQRVANRILELDRRNPGGLLECRGSYADYLELKEQTLAAQERSEWVLRNTLRRETEWLRRGPKARTTKQQARIQRAEDLKDQVSELEYRNTTRQIKLDFQGTERTPNRLLEAKKVTKSYGDRQLFRDVDIFLGPGSRIGLLGHNGCGKSTLIRVLLGEEKPDHGHILTAQNLRAIYFAQHRELLDPDITVGQTVAPKGDHVIYRGKAQHVRSYLGRFLFRVEQVDMKVGKLSGGEQSRLCLAQLMLREADILVLDEPTNDLDVATLNVLEEVLEDFPGAVLLVTHDRYFLDSVTNQILAFAPKFAKPGPLTAFADLAQWEIWYAELEAEEKRKAAAAEALKKAASTPVETGPKKRKLSFKEQREYDTMEGTIQATEEKIAKLTDESNAPENVSNAGKLHEIFDELAKQQAELERLYARWSELESIKA
jgi:ATP-binding cassette subfamily F protein uup